MKVEVKPIKALNNTGAVERYFKKSFIVISNFFYFNLFVLRKRRKNFS